ncbi:MAG TPA: macro domain-containing protein [Polyangia bacterium]|jgi:O-acetyl-ADP-ribose deacetylase (regulator of RNase III)|nr:macro domain-containing protein [Polyangia bacterium]
MQIHVAECDLTDLPVDAVVNPTNSLGLMTQGVAASLLKKGGQIIEDEAKASAPIAVGAAVVTTGGTLYARHVIHVPTIEEPGAKPSIESIRRATRAALVASVARGLNTIGLPPIVDSANAVPFEETARAMVDELRAHRQTIPSTVYLVTLQKEMLFAFEDALRNAYAPG